MASRAGDGLQCYKDNGLSPGEIAAIVIGVLLLILIVIGVFP
jgi:hypothetical protein